MRRKSWLLIVALVLVAGFAAGSLWLRDRASASDLDPGILAASGRIEAEELRIGATTGGRVLRLGVEEGDSVHVGHVLARLDTRTLEAAAAGARAAVDGAVANAEAAERHVAALESQVALARTEAARYRRLYERDAAPRQAAEQAEAALVRLENEARAAAATRALAARQVEVARTQLQAAELQVEESTIVAPVPGQVEAVLVRAGEIVAPDMPLVVLREAEDARLVLYLPLLEGERVRPGTEARVHVEAFPDRAFEGRVARVASEAEFTPKDVHMPDERATLVFAVELRVPNPEGLLKDGFPADAYLRVDPRSPWPERRPW